jgi:hypothetical protein
MQDGFLGERNPAVEAQDVHSIVGAKGNLDARDGPLKLKAG